ncbi:isocitrate lyase/PEP mutase family protein [Nocardiopsis coralliicola]
MGPHPSPARKLRELLAEDGLLVAPGAYDCVSARAVQHSGARACYMTGAGTAAMLGYPDYGLATLTEMADNAGRMAAAIGIPLIADADTGYGNELNVIRTVAEYERRGVAGIHLEDQEYPKRCGHLDGKRVIGRDAYLAKIRAAVGERSDPDFVIIARTDARAVLGFDEAVERARLALDAGADIAFVEAPQTPEEVAAIPGRVGGPCLLNSVAGGKTPATPFAEAAAHGYALCIVPGITVSAALSACDRALADMWKQDGTPAGTPPLTERFRRFGSEDWDALQARYA